MECLEQCRARYGERFIIYPVGMRPVVFLSAPDEIRAVATAPADVLHPGAGGDLMEPVFGDRAFVLHEESEHMRGRAAVVPAFRRGAIRKQRDVIAFIVAEAVASWPEGVALPIAPSLRRLTMRVILAVVIGVDSLAEGRLENRLLEMLSVMSSVLLQAPMLRRLPGWRATWTNFLQQRREAHEMLGQLICRRRRESNLNGDLLDRLLVAQNADGSALSDQQVRHNLLSVIVAGHETTAATLAWAFQLLAHSPDVQGRLVEEVDHGGDGAYMEATIQEVLRHRPTFLFLPPRVVRKPIEVGGFTYRPPMQLAGCIYLMHHDPEIYPDPDVFRPERFMDAAPNPSTLVPWGIGRKSCPGRDLALLEIRLVLREVLSARVVCPASRRLERPGWSTALVTPRAGSQVILRTR